MWRQQQRRTHVEPHTVIATNLLETLRSVSYGRPHHPHIHISVNCWCTQPDFLDLLCTGNTSATVVLLYRVPGNLNDAVYTVCNGVL